MSPYKRNIFAILALRAIVMALFPVAIISLFWKQELGMSMEDIMLLQAAFSIVICTLEFPGGYIGDRLGYKASLLLGCLTMVVGWSLYCISESFWHVLGAEVIMGMGMTLISGCDQAMLYESLKAESQLDKYGEYNRRYVMIGQTAESLAALSAGWLYSISTRLPFMIEVVVFAFGVILVLLLKEPPRQLSEHKHKLEDFKAILKSSFVNSPALRWVLLLSGLFSLASYYPVWIVQLYAESAGLSPKELGIVWACANATVVLGAAWSHKLEHRFGHYKLMLGCVILVICGYIGLGSSYGRYGVCFYFLITFMRGINFSLLTERIQNLAASQYRASMLSLRSLLVRGSFAATAPALGWWMDHSGFHTILLCMGAVLGIGLSILLWQHNQAAPKAEA